MAHSDMTAFVAEIPVHDKKKMEEFQEVMNTLNEETDKYISKIAKELNISEGLAMDVWYLRTRSRWTQELEDAFIKANLEGHKMVSNGDEVDTLKKLGYLDWE